MQLGNGKNNKILKPAMEVASITDNLTICINKLKRVRQRLISGQLVQPTALLPIRHYFTQREDCQSLGLFILETVISDEEFSHLSDLEQQSVQMLFAACKAYSVDQSTEHKEAVNKVNETVVALQPGKKRIWIHATRRKVNNHLLLVAEYCGYIFTKDWPVTWAYEASIAYVFGYKKHRYVIEQNSVNRLNRLLNI